MVGYLLAIERSWAAMIRNAPGTICAESVSLTQLLRACVASARDNLDAVAIRSWLASMPKVAG